MDKQIKLSACLGFALAGWLIPASMPLQKPLQGIALSGAFVAAVAGAGESKRESIRGNFAKADRRHELELLATELALSHEAKLRELYSALGFGDEDDGYSPSQPALPGGHIHQGKLGAASQADLEQFDIDWLLRSNSQHFLIVGDTGSGKTTLAQWLALSQFQAKNLKVYDPDYDGHSWKGCQLTTAPGEDYSEIHAQMLMDLEDFAARQPSNPSNPKTVMILDEMPDALAEIGEDASLWLKRLLRRGRKRNLFLMGMTQDRNADTLLIKGQAALLRNFTIAYLQGEAFEALDRVRDRGHRSALQAQLNQCQRPALVQFKGKFYTWDRPDLSAYAPSPGAANTTPNPTPMGEQLNGTIDRLNALLDAPPALPQHLTILIATARENGGSISLRDAYRAPGLNQFNRDKMAGYFQELQSLGLATIQTDTRYPDRLILWLLPHASEGR